MTTSSPAGDPALSPVGGPPPPAITAAWRVLARSVCEAISPPPPAPGRDSDGSYHRLLSGRCEIAAAELRHVLGNSRAGTDDTCAAASIVREQCAAMLAGYQTAHAGHGGERSWDDITSGSGDDAPLGDPGLPGVVQAGGGWISGNSVTPRP